MKKIIIGLLIIMMLVSGCAKKEAEANDIEIDNIEKEDVEVIEIDNGNDDVVKEDNEEAVKDEVIKEEPKKEEVVFDENKTYATLTGLEIDEADINNRAFAVMLDNHYAARPQAGLSEADIVYEILAEGRITRYMAIFQSNYPTNIGPVRSARPYFLKKSLEFNAFYTHVGGSPQGLKDIKTFNSYDIDAMSCRANTFWRVNHKNIPHNMYTSSEAIIKEAKRKNYKLKEELNFLDFYNKDTKINGQKADIIKFGYKAPTASDSVGYTSEYRFDSENGLYTRYTNGKKYIDENNKEILKTKNILVQYAKTVVLDNKGRRDIDIVGEGKGLYFTNGEYINVTWKKNDARGLTKFYSESGEEIKLNRGKTWIQIVPLSLDVDIN